VDVLKRIAQLGGLLIFISGVVNLLLGIQVGAVFYEIYPGGRLGHVGIVSGLVAIVMGVLLVHVAAPRLGRAGDTSQEFGGELGPRRRKRGAVLVFSLALMGSITGALYVGTAGMALCCVAAGWAFFRQDL
jgi:hypothetical protein